MRLTLTSAVLLVWVLALGCGAGEERDDLPVVLNYPRSVVAGFQNPTGSPPGADDRSCKPSARHPRPVVLVHGTFNNRASTWNALSPLLKNAGYCVFSLNFGAKRPGSAVGATESIDESARQLARFVDDVLRTTRARKVDIVGYSQGGMMPRQYIDRRGGARKVASLIALAPSNRGTNGDLSRLADRIAETPGPLRSTREAAVRALRQALQRRCRACAEQLADSAFMKQLNDPYVTRREIRYTVIGSRSDGVLKPFTSMFLPPGPNVTNITLQDVCALDKGDHFSMPFDPVALHLVTNALDPEHASPPRCVRVRAGIGA